MQLRTRGGETLIGVLVLAAIALWGMSASARADDGVVSTPPLDAAVAQLPTREPQIARWAPTRASAIPRAALPPTREPLVASMAPSRESMTSPDMLPAPRVPAEQSPADPSTPPGD